MHIPDGILPLPVVVGGYGTAAAITWYSLRRIQQQPDPQANIPKASLLTAAFFIASWVHIPIPPSSLHLVFNGIMGAMLGFYAMPAILIGLLFQAVMFQHGGLSTLGVNATMVGIPALLAAGIFHQRRRLPKAWSVRGTQILAFLAGATGVLGAAVIFFGILVTTLPAQLDVVAERQAIFALTIAHIPLALIEGGGTLLLVDFLRRVKPSLLDPDQIFAPATLALTPESDPASGAPPSP